MNIRGGNYKWSIVVMDMTALALGFFLCIRILSFDIQQALNSNIFPWLAASILIFFSLFDLYTDWRRKRLQNLFYSIILSMSLVYLGYLISTIFSPISSSSHLIVFFIFLIETSIILLFRTGVWFVIKKMTGIKKVVIIGAQKRTAEVLADKFLNHNTGWFEIAGIYAVEEIADVEIPLNQYDIFVLSSEISKELKEVIVCTCLSHGKEVLIVPQLVDLAIQGAVLQQVDDMLVISVSPPKLGSAIMVNKRVFDIIFATILLIFFSPLILLLYILIPRISTGPALFKQERVGMNGRPFEIYKFRSMIQDAEKLTGPVLAMEMDPRITAIGKIMRAARMDELPQLFNVLKGDMSLVGPRPERAFFIDQFRQTLPDYTLRLSVKPGVTGLAQIQGNYSTSVEDKLRYDLMYIQSCSLTLDIKILLQTIRVVVQRKQAQGVKEANLPAEMKFVSLEKKERAISR